MALHKTQEAILSLLRENKGKIEGFSLRDIGEKVGVGRTNPQGIAHHLGQLQKKGLVRKDPTAQNRYVLTKAPIPEIAHIPLYGMAECGPEGLLAEDTVLDRIPLSTRVFGISNSQDFFLVKARGRSMEPVIKEGDLVLIHKQAEVDPGSMALILHGDVPKIKRIIVNEIEGKKIYNLVSLNNDFPDEEIRTDESDPRILGLVKAIIRTPKVPTNRG